MSTVTKVEHIEEIDSPAFSDPHPPPLFPKNNPRLSSDEPEIPSRRPKTLPAKLKSEQSFQKSNDRAALFRMTSERASGTENPAFTDGEGNENVHVCDDIVDHFDENLYESYDASLYQNITMSGIPGGIVCDNLSDDDLPRNEPGPSGNSKTETDREFIRRQSSTSGLPELVLSLNTKVEMGEAITANTEEEIDGTSFSDSTDPPLLPKSVSKSSLDTPPEIPSRRQKVLTATSTKVKSAAKEDQPQAITTTTAGTPVSLVKQQTPLRENPLFTNDFDFAEIAPVHDGDIRDITLTEDYEVPVATNRNGITAESEVPSQPSFSSGLPDVSFNIDQNIDDNDENHIDSDDDIYDNLEVEKKLDGLPVDIGFLDINDLPTYAYVDNRDTVCSHKTEDTHTVSNVNERCEPEEDSVFDVDNHGAHTYFVLEQTECENERIDPQEQISESNKHGSQNPIADDENYKSSEIGLPFETINTDQSSDTESEYQNVTVVRDKPNGQVCELVPPKVPPRRDLEAQNPDKSSNHIVFTIDSEEEDEKSLNSADAAASEIELRRGKRVSDISNTFSIENSYFLDMEDSSKEMSEIQQKRISVHKMGDNEMPLSELLHLYVDEKVKTANDSGVQTEINIDTNETQSVDNAEGVRAASKPANGLVKSGSLLDDSDEFQMDETLGGILAPVRPNESVA